jgi:RNA polymerase sigma factor (sigma-70 family)
VDLDDLLASLRADEPGARDAFGFAVYEELKRFFSQRFSHEDTKELTQATFDVVWQKLDSFEPQGRGSFGRWLRTIAANKALVLRQTPLRERARHSKLSEHQRVASPMLTPSTVVLRHEQRELVERHKANLPDHERRALDHELADGDDRALAEEEGIAVKSAASRRYRAKQHLQESIEAARKTPDSQASTPS